MEHVLDSSFLHVFSMNKPSFMVNPMTNPMVFPLDPDEIVGSIILVDLQTLLAIYSIKY